MIGRVQQSKKGLYFSCNEVIEIACARCIAQVALVEPLER